MEWAVGSVQREPRATTFELEKIISEYAAIPYAYGEIERRTLFDRQKDTYLLLINGWEKNRRVHGIIIHADIYDELRDRLVAKEREAVLRDATEFPVCNVMSHG